MDDWPIVEEQQSEGGILDQQEIVGDTDICHSSPVILIQERPIRHRWGAQQKGGDAYVVFLLRFLDEL